MRLKSQEIEAIVKNFRQTFGDGELYLFGSRVDDSKKGGDIDLLVCPHNKSELSRKKIDFLVSLKKDIEDQKIDIAIERNGGLAIEQIARKTGELLWKS